MRVHLSDGSEELYIDIFWSDQSRDFSFYLAGDPGMLLLSRQQLESFRDKLTELLAETADDERIS